MTAWIHRSVEYNEKFINRLKSICKLRIKEKYDFLSAEEAMSHLISDTTGNHLEKKQFALNLNPWTRI
jgi:hypothetical protein